MGRLLRHVVLAAALLLGVSLLAPATSSATVATPTLWGPSGGNVNFWVQRASDASIRGSGFDPNTAYTLSAPYGAFGASQSMAVTTDANGDFDWVDFTLGTDVPFSVSKFTVSATDQSGTAVATIEADVFPPQFDAGYCPGQSETVTGRGFPDGTYSIATSDSTGVALSASTVTPVNGVITVGVIPADVPPLKVQMTLTSQADPSVTWSTTWDRAGSYNTGSITDQTFWSMQAHASCFIPGETVDVVTHDTTTIAPTSVIADSHGSISFTIGLHPIAATHQSDYLSISGEQSGQSLTLGGNVTVWGTQLHPGQVFDGGTMLMVSPNPGYKFELSMGCDPAIEQLNPDGSGRPVWDAGLPPQSTSCHMEISESGNLAIYSNSGALVWATHTRGTSAGNYARMRQDGNLAIYSATGALVWLSNPITYIPSTNTYLYGGPQSPPAAARLASGATLRRGHYIRNGNTRLELLSNGNIVVLRSTRTVWSSRTAGHGGVALTMQHNGGLVLRNAAGRVVWASGTANRGLRDQVIVGANGDVAIWSSAHRLIWHTGTGI